ncbi:hypothetical protein AMS68_007438 [Peltaster fructicola]|uniref:Uncharacterized protein n=1 Tax=Peltaster fructicola TaxID=286661 RepID=A0A6H0Y4S8_9PEZI|nr:hypothetical protein AMS68_007438 [Peltaster fructicola]
MQGRYPANFKNNEDIQFNSGCDGLSLLEWPLLENNDLFMSGDDQGSDRLILGVHTSNGKFSGLTICGCAYHPAGSNGFKTCTFDGSA